MKAIDTGIITKTLGDRDTQIVRVTKNNKIGLQKVEDNFEKTSEKISALKTLQNLIGEFTNQSFKVQNPANDFFSNSKANIHSNDTGSGANYIDITLEKGAFKGSFDVSVEQIATASKMIIKGEGTNGAIPSGNFFEGTLTINVGAISNVIDVVPTEDVSTIIANINAKFQSNNVRAEALAIETQNGKFIEIRHQELGPNILSANWEINNGISNLKPQDSVNGMSAKINVDGVEAEQNDNLFKNILPGVNINALTNNTPGKSQIVNIVSDPTAATSEVGALVTMYNKLSIFVAQMTERSGNKYTEKAILNNTSEIRQAQDLLSNFALGKVNNSGKYKTLSDIGLKLGINPELQDVPVGTETLIVDDALLKDAIINNFNDFSSLFKGSNNITSNGENQGSKLVFDGNSRALPLNIMNKDIIITTSIAGGAVNPAVDILIDNVHYNGMYKDGRITFDNNPLKGLVLNYDKNDVTDHNEIFTMKLTQGLAEVAYYKSSNIVSKDGLSGSVVTQIENTQKNLLEVATKKRKLEEQIERSTAKIIKLYENVAQLDFKTSFMIDYINNIINPPSSAP